MIFRVLALSIFIILCSWFFFWPVYEWMVGIRPFLSFMNQNQMMLFVLGLIGFFSGLFFGKKVTVG